MNPQLITQAPLAHLRWDPASGPGPVVLLLHGVGGGREAWADAGMGPGLSSGAALAAAGFTALALDLPGYGLSAPVWPYHLAALAGAVAALITQTQAGPAIVVGHSMGGMLAQELVASAPQVVAALVLAGTSAAFGKPGGDWQRDFLQSRFAPLDAGLGLAGLAAALVAGMVAPGTAPERQARAQALMAGVPEATYRAAVSALVAFDRRARLADIAVPTLVITGEFDRTAAPEVARKMAERIPGAALCILPGAGHLLNIEQPVAFNAALLAFMRGLARP